MVSAIRNNMQSVSSKVSSSSANIQTFSLSVPSYVSLEFLQVVWQIYLLHAIIRQWGYQMCVSVWTQQSLHQQNIKNTVHKFKPVTQNIKRSCYTTTNRCNSCRCRYSNMMSAMQVMMRGKYTHLLMLIFYGFTKYLRHFIFHIFVCLSKIQFLSSVCLNG